MANLKDIAQKLGVSVSTVSRGLNGGKAISREMTEKILKAADELGYTLQGRGGRATPDWNSAGIIVPEVASEYYARLVHKAKDFLAAKGYSLIMKLTDFKAAELLDAINTMSRIHVKCLLVVMDTEENMSDQLISAMHRSGLPIMLITSKYYPLLEFDCIHLDEYSGIIMGVQHLQKRGYQRIACISDRISLSRVTVFKQAMKLQGMKVVQAGFRILGAMAGRRQYQLPVETESGMKVVNLTMQTGGVEARGITIRMAAGVHGMLQAQIRMDEAGTCTGEILGGSSEANTWLAGQTDEFRELLAGSEYADAAVALGESRTAARGTNGGADTQKLCRAAIFFVKAMAKLTDI
mgnify:CR=1 FL=1